eukprot:GHVU01059356.1.p1 GENE.GHVU01059356.1~~GHVU01059356.1.p1  ORF type:complete len:149 (+),score=19.22 GHVU01059356.1:137-583(+)
MDDIETIGHMGSMPGFPGTSSSPVRKPAALMSPDDEDIDDDDLDETLSERLWGLTEMFPEPVRNVTHFVAGGTWGSTKWLWGVGKVALWVGASSATILALPIMFETERAQMEEQQKQQQRQILLGPNAAMSGHSGLNPGLMPNISPPR